MLVSMPVLAQQHEEKPRNNEIGLMADLSVGDVNDRIRLAGVQFRHFKNNIYRNNTFGYRISAGIGDVRHDGGSGAYYSTGNIDTVYRVNMQQWQHLYFIGVGVDAQRPLYKSVWIYAALNLTLGYGKSGVDSGTDYYYRSARGEYVSSSPRITSTQDLGGALWIGGAPSLGAKIALGKRIWLGTEFTTMLTISNAATSSTSGRIIDMNLMLGQVNERFYVSWRF